MGYMSKVIGLLVVHPYLLGNLGNEAGFYRIRGFTAGLNLSDAQWSIFNAEAFICTASQTASFRAKAGVPTWRYRYFGDWDNLRLYDCCPGSAAYHGSELEIVFGTAVNVSGTSNESPEERLSRMMRKVWGGVCEGSEGGLESVGMARYGSRKRQDTLVRLAFENGDKVSIVRPIVYDAPCAALGGSVEGAQGAF
ncbi:hypothetical protein C8J57DRAFT_1659015 [Mycena rebaudengoi]|nr:hypothetical protein C8J57DRAFT_1659015 [Mycena rebaudengoi]